MTGTIGKQLAANPPVSNGSSFTATMPSATSTRAASYEQKVVVLPAGFFGDLLSKFSGTIGEVAGGAFGNAALGKTVGDAASGLVKLLPFSIVPPSVSPQSAGPGGGGGSDEALVVVPAGFIGGLLGGIGGNLLGGEIGKFFGAKDTGANIGKAAGGILGGLLPFQVVPPQIAPASVGPDGEPSQEPMVVVPAGFFGNLLKGVASTIAYSSGNKTVQTIAGTAAGLSDLLPFQDVPPTMVQPMGAGPDGQAAEQERMIVVPAGFFGNLLSGLADTVGGAIGGAFGDAQTGRAIGAAAKPLLGLLPFHAVPPEFAPQSTGPDGGGQQEELMIVPAGLFGGLLSTYAGAIGEAAGGLFGSSATGRKIGEAAAPLVKLLPFSVQGPSTVGG